MSDHTPHISFDSIRIRLECKQQIRGSVPCTINSAIFPKGTVIYLEEEEEENVIWTLQQYPTDGVELVALVSVSEHEEMISRVIGRHFGRQLTHVGVLSQLQVDRLPLHVQTLRRQFTHIDIDIDIDVYRIAYRHRGHRAETLCLIRYNEYASHTIFSFHVIIIIIYSSSNMSSYIRNVCTRNYQNQIIYV